MDSVAQLIKGQEFELMKHLLYAKDLVINSENKDEVLQKASEMVGMVSEKYAKLKSIAEKTTDFQKKIIEKKVEAYKVKAEELRSEIERIRARNHVAAGRDGNRLEDTLASAVKTQNVGALTLGKLKGQRESIERFSAWSIKKDVNESNSALVDLYVKKSKIKVSIVVIIVLQIFIFLLVLKIKLS